METKLARIAETAKTKPEEKFTSLVHLINEEMLIECHQEISGRKAVGIDKISKEEYEQNLESNIEDLLKRMKRQAYKPQAVRRVYIEKAGSNKKRPLGIPAYEDKIVQLAIVKILSAVYEQDFLDCSYGFRPGRGCHDALKILTHTIEKGKVNYIVDADIKGFFDHVDHEWLMKFLKHRITDPNLLRIVVRFLKAGVMEAGIKYETPEGTPQGGVISPLLANVYLHYVLDLWFYRIVRKKCKGKAYMVRYADDTVWGFQHEEDARNFYVELKERLAKFNLEVAEEKTKIISFGKKANQSTDRGEKPEERTFDFLGFTHYGGKGRHGNFRVKKKTSGKKLRASMKRCKEWIKRNRNLPAKELMSKLRMKLIGYYRYYGITDNYRALMTFLNKVIEILYKWLNRRSQRKSFGWEKYKLFLNKYKLPLPKVYVNIYELEPRHIGWLRGMMI